MKEILSFKDFVDTLRKSGFTMGGGNDFDDDYFSGNLSHMAKRIYELVEQNGALPVHVIRQEGGFGKEGKSQFDRAITELQMKLYITMCGNVRKLSMRGEEYGWPSTVFCTVGQFWGESILDQASRITREEAIEKITKQIYALNPDADSRRIGKFINR